MARETYTVQSGDTLKNIARKYYGAANESERIVNTNSVLQNRRASGDSELDGTPNVHPGDVLTLIVPETAKLSPSGKAPDELTLYLNNNEVSLPEGSRLTRYFDACCSQFVATFGWDPNSNLDRALWGNPLNLPECSIFAGDTQIFGGRFENSKNITQPDESRMSATARSHTFEVQKSVLPSTRYPVERENEDLYELCKWVVDIFGLDVEELSDNREKFKKVSCKKDQNLYEWLANLASTRGRVLSDTPNGYGFYIWNPQEAESVGRFVEGEAGFNPPEIEFDTTALHQTYITSARRTRRASDVKIFRDFNLTQQTYAYLDVQAATSGERQIALEYAARKKYREFFNTPFNPGGGLLNPQGDLWAPGQLVTLNCPSSRIFFDMDFLVRSVTYIVDIEEKRVELEIVPPWVYLRPEDAAEAQARDLSMWT